MRHEPDWRGIAAVLTVVGVFTVLIIGAINGGRNANYILSDEALATISTILGAAIGAVAVYLGGRRRGPPGGGKKTDASPLPEATSVSGGQQGSAGLPLVGRTHV